MGIKETIYQRIKDEVTQDTNALGYAGKTPQEIYDILVKPIVKNETVQVELRAPVLKIINNIAEGPNTITLQDVVDALK